MNDRAADYLLLHKRPAVPKTERMINSDDPGFLKKHLPTFVVGVAVTVVGGLILAVVFDIGRPGEAPDVAAAPTENTTAARATSTSTPAATARESTSSTGLPASTAAAPPTFATTATNPPVDATSHDSLGTTSAPGSSTPQTFESLESSDSLEPVERTILIADLPPVSSENRDAVGTVEINGASYPHVVVQSFATCLRTPAERSINLGRLFDTFEGSVGYDDNSRHSFPMRVTISVDGGPPLWERDLMLGDAFDFSLDISGASRLTLKTTSLSEHCERGAVGFPNARITGNPPNSFFGE